MIDRTAVGAAVLTGRGLSKSFGGVKALQDVDINVTAGATTALIGPNGAGKSTLVNVLTGVYRQDRGSISLQDTEIGALAPDKRARAGVLRTFQRVRLFPQLTVLENALAGRWAHGSGKLSTEVKERALRELDCFSLAGYAERSPASLTFADCRRLELVRCLLADPRVILLDEPAAGMNPEEAQRFVEQIADIQQERGLATLLIEHNMTVVMRLAAWIYVLDFGRMIASGTPQQVRNDQRVVEAYLGSQS